VGAVSEEVARAMADGAARAFGADAGIGITGIAGPTGGTAEKPVGLVWYAVSVGGETTAEKRQFLGDREAVRERSAQAALNLLYRKLGAG
jgi:PncC family amidohydrolase